MEGNALIPAIVINSMNYQSYKTYELVNDETKVVKSFQIQPTGCGGWNVLVVTVDGSKITGGQYSAPIARLLWNELVNTGWVRR